MSNAKTLFSAFALLLAVRLAPAVAQQAPPEGVQPEVQPPAVQTDHGIPYRTGGVGKDERDALLATTSDYPLKVVFAGKQHREFVAEVTVDIFDQAGGKIFEANDTGPLLFVKVPSGEYKIAASLNGRTLEQTAVVASAEQTHVGFYW